MSMGQYSSMTYLCRLAGGSAMVSKVGGIVVECLWLRLERVEGARKEENI